MTTTLVLTESWEELFIATLDPEGWTFPAEWMRPVEDATKQIVTGVFEAAVGRELMLIE